ncbi:LysR family transcriptional regulator [Massilia sp. CCM 9210]|uniref:LysR family transcriptional regulator n=1 Tax=Massilia scottii TaxID=3057166 RepID=UPI0027964F41|nr:LysR family transcriptional regulator [Massilia sp. CCM 9210]MDQ1816346.1 LysR family transcriptional regulator [Massilia sp. CCM 9210]
MIDNILDLNIFARVVHTGSMTDAAGELDLSLAVVSKRMAALEDRLGVRLLNRTTRKQSLTQEGARFHQRCIRILAEVQDAEADMTDSRTSIAGLLRVAAPRGFGRRYLSGIVAAFQRQHPALCIELSLEDAFVDLVDSAIDVALRFGNLNDSSMIARPVATGYRIMCASPGYIERHGEPLTPEDLVRHACIVYRADSTRHWVFERDGKAVTAAITPTFFCNDGDAAQAIAREGGGIFYKALWDVSADLDDGSLVRVLKQYSAPSEPLQVVYPHALHLSPRVRQFADFAIERLRAQLP